jgi:hypothetical protein
MWSEGNTPRIPNSALDKGALYAVKQALNVFTFHSNDAVIRANFI